MEGFGHIFSSAVQFKSSAAPAARPGTGWGMQIIGEVVDLDGAGLLIGEKGAPGVSRTIVAVAAGSVDEKRPRPRACRPRQPAALIVEAAKSARAPCQLPAP